MKLARFMGIGGAGAGGGLWTGGQSPFRSSVMGLGGAGMLFIHLKIIQLARHEQIAGRVSIVRRYGRVLKSGCPTFSNATTTSSEQNHLDSSCMSRSMAIPVTAEKSYGL